MSDFVVIESICRAKMAPFFHTQSVPDSGFDWYINTVLAFQHRRISRDSGSVGNGSTYTPKQVVNPSQKTDHREDDTPSTSFAAKDLAGWIAMILVCIVHSPYSPCSAI